MKTKILVTGAGGFIGSHVARRLAKDGHSVIGLDNGFTSTHDKIKGVKLIKGDITNPHDLEKTGNDFKVVVHLAGLLGTNEIAQLGLIQLANQVNINGTVNILDFCKKIGASLIFATKPNPRNWINPYTITKQAAEDYCLMYANEYKVNTIALSLFWVFGPEQRQEPVNKFIPTFMKYALTNQPIPIWNNGRQIIDCVYIDDVTEAFSRAVKRLISKDHPIGFTRIDIGTGVPVSVLEVANTVIKLTHSNSKFKFLGKRLGEPYDSAIIANTATCKRELGFIPEIKLEKGLKKCLSWFKKRYKHK